MFNQSECEAAAKEMLRDNKALKALELVTIIRVGTKEYEEKLAGTKTPTPVSSFKVDNIDFAVFMN